MVQSSSSLLTEFPELAFIQSLARKRKIKVYLVGGFLRDRLLGRTSFDLDFAVSKNAIALARVFAKSVKGAFVLLDEEHNCARVVRKKQNQILTFDFAGFRDKTIGGDLAHRDFTINALAVDIQRISRASPLENILIDEQKSLNSIKSKTIRMVSKKSFCEDPLRLIRAFSVQAETHFKIEKETLAQIKKDKERLQGTSYERIRDELFKILLSDKTYDVINAMDRIGLLEKVIPQISVMFGCVQGGYHHLDVWPHSKEALRQLEGILQDVKKDPDLREYLNEQMAGDRNRESLLKLAMLLHDIGKPETKKKENDRMSFHGHEHVGQHIVRHIANMLKVSTRERYMLEDMVRWHLRPGYLGDFKKPTERAIFRYFRDTKEEAASILLLSIADQRSTRGPLTTDYDQKHHEAICRKLLGRFFDKKKEKPLVRLINGHDLIRTLKLKPSPIFAKILRAVEEKQALGEITTKKEAMILAGQMIRPVREETPRRVVSRKEHK